MNFSSILPRPSLVAFTLGPSSPFHHSCSLSLSLSLSLSHPTRCLYWREITRKTVCHARIYILESGEYILSSINFHSDSVLKRNLTTHSSFEYIDRQDFSIYKKKKKKKKQFLFIGRVRKKLKPFANSIVKAPRVQIWMRKPMWGGWTPMHSDINCVSRTPNFQRNSIYSVIKTKFSPYFDEYKVPDNANWTDKCYGYHVTKSLGKLRVNSHVNAL